MLEPLNVSGEKYVRKENFSKNIIEEQEFDIGGEISVNSILAKELVVFDMIFLIDDKMTRGHRQDFKQRSP